MSRMKPEDVIAGKGRPFTGAEYLESLRDDREVYVYGERVADVTAHPAFRNAARSIARLYDSLHDPKHKEVLTTPTDTGSGSFTHKLFRVAQSREDLIGQREAIVAVSNAVRRARSGLSDPNRPIGSFLFLGPTGVGKTELARALAEFLFDDERAMIRIDMSEYMEKHTVSRLIGAPPGYVGYDEGGQLTEAVRRRPYSVVLFDEIEKAHGDVFNVLLQLLDDGRLTDGHGRTVDFRNTVVIMTSNLGSQFFREETDLQRVRALILDLLKQALRPEFLNRIDEIVIFQPLGREEIAAIVEIQARHLVKRLADRRVTLELRPAAKALLAQEGYDPVYGARPLKRTIQRMIQDSLALELLNGTFGEGDTVAADVDHGKVVFRKTAEATPA